MALIKCYECYKQISDRASAQLRHPHFDPALKGHG